MPSGPGGDEEEDFETAVAIHLLVTRGADLCFLSLGAARWQPCGGRSGQTEPQSFIPGSRSVEGRGNGGAHILRPISSRSIGFGGWLPRGNRTRRCFSRP